MDSTINQIISLLSFSKKQDFLCKSVLCLQEQIYNTLVKLSPEKLILVQEFLNKLVNQTDIYQRPPPSYFSTPSYTNTPNDSDTEKEDCIPLNAANIPKITETLDIKEIN
jgi:hypothetical protein